MSLKARLAAGERLIGTFVKTPHPHVVEVLALTALDCLVLDAEHAPFDRAALDACIMAARAGGLDVLVRTPSAAPEHILNALDCGATGVLVPHVRSAAAAQAAVDAATYMQGRGYAGSSRAAGYGTRKMADHIAASNAGVVVIAQIEDVQAIDAIEEIAAVPGIDCLFVGRADLTVAYGSTDQDAPEVVAAVERVCAVGLAHGRPTGMFLGRPADAPGWADQGARLFLLGSDHAFLLSGAAALVATARG